MKEIKTLACMKTSMDGAHCGLTDWYPKIEAGIQKALKSKSNWTTGWYASKKEIATAKITKVGKELTIEVSVSDDFDTEGISSTTIPLTQDLEVIRKTIYTVWEGAEDNQKDNRQYMGFSILKKEEGHDAWVETYIRNVGGQDSPPGDSYHQWGFQDECKIPKKIKDKFEKWAENYGSEHCEKSLKVDKWTIKAWDEEDCQ